MASLTEQAAAWMHGLRYEDLPAEVVASAKLRLLDSLGLMLIAGAGPFGAAILEAVSVMGEGSDSSIVGTGRRSAPMLAAMANGALAEALQFDDTHNETIIHATSPASAAALAAGEAAGAPGRDVLTAFAGGTELTCRVGVIAPGQFHGRGLHPTGIVGTFGSAYAACKLMKLGREQTAAALGHAASFASGILACWEDGTDTQFLHPGWSAHAAIAAACYACAGLTGPKAAIEGRFGLIASHIQDRAYKPDFGRMTRGLGEDWESLNTSFKPYPAAHIIHPFLDAILHLHSAEGLRAAQVQRITIRPAAYMIGVMCEPASEKLAPKTPAHGRVSLQYSLAEALYRGRLDGSAYSEEDIRNPEILALARKIGYEADSTAPGTERYKGWVIVETTDGRRLERIEDYNWGSRERPMTEADVQAKFRANARRALDESRIDRVIGMVGSLEKTGDIRALMDLCR
jgi:2-methylcitrate dehydratase PrpD